MLIIIHGHLHLLDQVLDIRPFPIGPLMASIEGMDPLLMAIKHGRYLMVIRLLDLGLGHWTSLNRALSMLIQDEKAPVNIIERILQSPTEQWDVTLVNVCDPSTGILHAAIKRGDKELLARCLTHPSFNAEQATKCLRDGMDPLHYACATGSPLILVMCRAMPDRPIHIALAIRNGIRGDTLSSLLQRYMRCPTRTDQISAVITELAAKEHLFKLWSMALMGWRGVFSQTQLDTHLSHRSLQWLMALGMWTPTQQPPSMGPKHRLHLLPKLRDLMAANLMATYVLLKEGFLEPQKSPFWRTISRLPPEMVHVVSKKLYGVAPGALISQIRGQILFFHREAGTMKATH